MDSDFIKEKIKDKPINKRRLVIRILITIGLAVLFGIIAAFVYVVTAHNISSRLYPDQPDIINIPSDEEQPAVSEDTVSADTKVSADEVSENASEAAAEQAPVEHKTVINNITNKVDMTPESYEKLYASLHETAMEAERSLVSVTGVSSDTDWFENTYQNEDQSAGLIIADNGRELLILTNSSATDGAEKINVEFCDGKNAEAETKKSDSNTGLEIIGVDLASISDNTIDEIKMADLGNSNSASLVGSPVIAIGSPLGIDGSEAYGLITSTTKEEQMIDMSAHLLTTDIYGSKSASGVIINYSGSILGLITDKYSSDDTANIIMTYSISDMKNLIEHLANGQDKAYLGVYGTDVTDEAANDLSIPKGAYVTKTEVGSPAMEAGIQSGDVITKIGTTEITDYSDYMDVMNKSQPDDDTVVTVQRYAKGEYTELTFDVKLRKKD